ncbi:MAG: glycosyltransferase [Phycisphaerales bacterium JB043]
MLDGSLDALLAHRAGGLRVGLRSDPSNICDVFRGTSLDASTHHEGNVSSYYTAPQRPSDDERRVIDAGAIDLLRSPLAAGVFEVAYRGFLEAGLSVLEEPFGADPVRDSPIQCARDGGLVYVGRCWSFKWQNMGGYVDALRASFGSGFQLYGEGWPEGYSSGYLPDDRLREVLCRASVVVSLHEPSQVMGFAFAPNERVHKLLAMGCCVVSDPNPILETYYTGGEDLVIASSPEDMVRLVGGLLDDPVRARRVATSGKDRTVRFHLYEHRAMRLLETLESDVEPGSIVTYRGDVRAGCCV